MYANLLGREIIPARGLVKFVPAPLAHNSGEKGILSTSKLDETEDFQCLGHSNWTICTSLNPFCSENFPSFSLSYWEAISYYPRGPIRRKGNSPNSRIGWDRWILMPGACKLDHLQLIEPILFWKFSIFFTFILGSHFLLPQRANYWGIHPTPELDETNRF